jgi:hypothetical protein
MKVIATLLLAVLLAGCAATTHAATPKSGDDFAIETTVLAVYNVISGPAGRRDWNRFEALFAPEAHMVVSRITDGAPATVVLTPKQYIERTTPIFNEKGFFERPIATRILRYGNIAQVWSTYETREAANQEKPVARGINSLQLVRIGSEWKVQSIVWQQEDAAHPIPSQFAPK